MNNSIYKINLELHEVGSQLTLTAKAYDTARQIRCTFTDNGRPYVITDDCFSVFTAKKPDGNILFNATHIDGNVVHYDFTVNTVNASGVLECEMRLYNGDGKLITSPRFSILVDDTVYHDGDVIESASEYTALTKLMEMVVSTLGEIPSPVLYGMAQELSENQKAQARENIGAIGENEIYADSVQINTPSGGTDVQTAVNRKADLEDAVLCIEQELTDEQKAQARENIGAVSQAFLPVAQRTGNVDDDYTATDEDSGTELPEVAFADAEHSHHTGKGRQIVFVPCETNRTTAPTLQINGGQAIPIRLRAPENQGSDEYDYVPDATLPVPVGALMRGVPYTMTFCGKYWLVDSLIDLHPDAVTEAAVGAMIAEAIGDTAEALAAMDEVIGGAEA